MRGGRETLGIKVKQLNGFVMKNRGVVSLYSVTRHPSLGALCALAMVLFSACKPSPEKLARDLVRVVQSNDSAAVQRLLDSGGNPTLSIDGAEAPIALAARIRSKQSFLASRQSTEGVSGQLNRTSMRLALCHQLGDFCRKIEHTLLSNGHEPL